MSSKRSFPDCWITPSRIDEYLQLLTGVKYNFGDMPPYEINDFIDNLLKISNPLSSNQHKADGGTAAHSMLEELQYGVPITGWSVFNNQIGSWNVIIDTDIVIQLPVIRESWVRGIIGETYLLGRVDAIDGIAVHDNKFTKQIDFEKYMESMQWKVYLYLTGRDMFVYNLFQVMVNDNQNIITIKDYQKLTLYAYDGMRQEVEEVIADYRELLISIKPLIIERIQCYNNEIDLFIQQLRETKVITAMVEIEEFITKLKQKYILIDGLNNDTNTNT